MLAGLAIWTLVVSTVTAVFYFWDKRNTVHFSFTASRRRLRPPFTVACGLTLNNLAGSMLKHERYWPGGLAAGQLFRHKTHKASFRIKFAICAAVSLSSLIAIVIATR